MMLNLASGLANVRPVMWVCRNSNSASPGSLPLRRIGGVLSGGGAWPATTQAEKASVLDGLSGDVRLPLSGS